jgi:hypothetical protein
MDETFDALDSFEVHEVLPQAPRSQPEEAAQETAEQLLGYLSPTHFFAALRNNYSSFRDFGQEDLRKLLTTGEILRVRKARSSMVVNFNQPTVCIVVFGEVVLEGKTFPKGDFFIILEDRVEIYFRHKTTLAMLHKEDIEGKLYQLENYYFKKKQIEKIMPTEVLQLSKQQVAFLAERAQTLEGTSTDTVLTISSLEKGIFLLFEGRFALKLDSGITLTEIGFDYYGEETLWEEDYAFRLEALSAPYRFIFLPKKALEAALSSFTIEMMKELYKKKVEIRSRMARNIRDNLEMTKLFMKRV